MEVVVDQGLLMDQQEVIQYLQHLLPTEAVVAQEVQVLLD